MEAEAWAGALALFGDGQLHSICDKTIPRTITPVIAKLMNPIRLPVLMSCILSNQT
jgi:hypothetical protein